MAGSEALVQVATPSTEVMDRRALTLLGLGHLFDDVNQGAVPAMLPFFMAAYGLTYAAAAGLVLALTITSSVVQPILGQISDRHPSPWLIPLGLFCAGGGVALASLMPSYWLACAAIGLSGLGVAAFHPEAARFASRAAGARRATGMSFFALGGWLADRYGKRLVVLAALAVLCPLLFGLVSVGSSTAAFALLVPIGIALQAPASVMVVMGQEYLPNRVGTASGVTMGLAVSIGGLAAPLLGQYADQHGIPATLIVLSVVPLLAAAFAATLPAKPPRPLLDSVPAATG